MSKNDLIKVGAIWVQETKAGDDMLSISLRIGDTEISCMAFQNDYKKEAKHPDFNIYANAEELGEEVEEEPKPRRRSFSKKKTFNKETSKSKFKKKTPFV